MPQDYICSNHHGSIIVVPSCSSTVALVHTKKYIHICNLTSDRPIPYHHYTCKTSTTQLIVVTKSLKIIHGILRRHGNATIMCNVRQLKGCRKNGVALGSWCVVKIWCTPKANYNEISTITRIWKRLMYLNKIKMELTSQLHLELESI